MSQSILNNSISTNGGLQIIKATGDYFCAQCLLQFQNDKEYKVHYKSELHLYNIKRRMLDLVPATPEQFEQKKKQIIDQQKKSIQSTKNGVQLADDFKCIPCNKSFNTESTFKAHVISKKHKESEKLYESKKQNPSSDVKETPKAPVITTDKDQTVCLFCDKKSADIEKNLEHMNKAHSFFISEEKYCEDKKGLLEHLGQKINITFLCILCENKGCKQFTTPEAVKKHMIDKGHCFMQSTVFDEYADFYDFTPQIEEAVEYQKTLKQNNALHEKVIEIVQNKKEGDNEEDCEEWESDIDSNESDQEDEEEDDEETSKKHKVKNTIKEQDEDEDEIQLEKKSTKAKKQNNDEEWEDEEGDDEEAKKKERLRQQKKYRIHRIKIAKATLNERGELELPNGKTLGHRTYRHIYKQYYRPISNYASRMKAILGEEGYRQRQLVLATQNFQIQLMKKYNAIKSHKEEKNLLAYQMHRNKVNYVNVGISHNKLQHHFVQQCPL